MSLNSYVLALLAEGVGARCAQHYIEKLQALRSQNQAANIDSIHSGEPFFAGVASIVEHRETALYRAGECLTWATGYTYVASGQHMAGLRPVAVKSSFESYQLVPVTSSLPSASRDR